MKLNMIVFFNVLIWTACSIVSQEQGTVIARFTLNHAELCALKPKLFVNNTNRDLVVRFKLEKKQDDLDSCPLAYVQEPLVKRGNSFNINLPALAKKIPGAMTNSDRYDFCVELLLVKQLVPLKVGKLKAGESAFAIHKNKFFKNDQFNLSRNRNGLLICDVSQLTAV